MGSLRCDEMRALEEEAFDGGALAEELMEKAGLGIAEAIKRRYPEPGSAIACIGSGNNGGDALVVLRYLAQSGWSVTVRNAVSEKNLRQLPGEKWRQLRGLADGHDTGDNVGKRIILDGLLGIGGSGAMREPLRRCADWINAQRARRDTDVVAIDIPSGLDGDTGEAYPSAVIADLTLTVGVPKRGLLMPAAVNYTGALELVPLDELPVPKEGTLFLNDVYSLRGVLPRRQHDFHKGNAGRVAIVAGSRGMLGAAVLCATGALRAGAGLVTLFAHEDVYALLAPMLPPEVMLHPVSSLNDIELEGFDGVAVGPGMGSGGRSEQYELLRFLEQNRLPVVLDADGLNRVAASGRLNCLREGMVITPHPGEMERLFPGSKKMPRMECVEQFLKRHAGVVLLLKGARSLVGQSGKPLHVNGTGHAGMACGGQGDVLSGVIVGLLAQGICSLDAARLGAWLCGRSAELAVQYGVHSQESLLATDVCEYLGLAFRELIG